MILELLMMVIRGGNGKARSVEQKIEMAVAVQC